MNIVQFWLELYGNSKIYSLLILTYALMALILSIIFLLKLTIAITKKNISPNQRYQKIWFFDLLIWPIILPIPMIVFYFILRMVKSYWKKAHEKWKNQPQVSKDGKPMKLLRYKQQDIALSKGLVAANKVKNNSWVIYATKDYSEVKVFSTIERWKYSDRNRWFKGSDDYYKYRQCPECRRKTLVEYKKTISKNKKQRINIWKCKNCQYEAVNRSKIGSTIKFEPRKALDNSNDTDILDDVFDSTSSGSSWGGGSSRGGGSSSKW